MGPHSPQTPSRNPGSGTDLSRPRNRLQAVPELVPHHAFHHDRTEPAPARTILLMVARNSYSYGEPQSSPGRSLRRCHQPGMSSAADARSEQRLAAGGVAARARAYLQCIVSKVVEVGGTQEIMNAFSRRSGKVPIRFHGPRLCPAGQPERLFLLVNPLRYRPEVRLS